MSVRIGRNDPCPCGSGKKFKRCCLDSPRRVASAAAATTQGRSLALTLLVDTPRGVMARNIPSASPLRADLSHGLAAEVATHDAAAVWGLPDFVFLPETLEVGSGQRELGDGIIIVGDLGAVVQVKSRAAPSDLPERERSWLRKKIPEAMGQGFGTIRRLRQVPRTLTNLRGTTLEIDAASLRWLVVVVIDHPELPDEFVPTVHDAREPTLVLLRRDWEFLFDQLKSTQAVMQYFERVAGQDHELGLEPLRYYDLAQADADAEPEGFPAELAIGGRVIAGPLLPMAPTASEDRRAHELVRTMFEDIALTRLTTASELDRLRILAELDRLPVTQRAEIGHYMFQAMREVTDDDTGDVIWRMRNVRGKAGGIHLGFGACSHPYKDVANGLGLWAQLRHHDVLSITKDVEGLTTVALLLTPRNDETRPWDTSVVAVSGPVDFEPEELARLRALFPYPSA